MRPANSGHRLHIGFVQRRGRDRRPVTDLRLLGVPHDGVGGKQFSDMLVSTDVRVELIENSRQGSRDQWL